MRPLAALLVIAVVGCRDGVEPFRPEPADDDGFGRRTYNLGHDDDPAWIGDTLLYAAESFPGVPATPGLLLRLVPGGSTAAALFPELQSPASGGPRFLGQPAPSPDGGRVAYVQLARVVQPRPGAAMGAQCLLPEPLIDSVAIQVRSLDGGDPPTAPAEIGFAAAGRDRAQDRGDPGPYVQTVHPFQLAFLEEHHLFFHPSWSPDGNRLVYSDGLRLYVHTIGGGTTPIPGTEDGVGPAWDPTGEWIAFTRIDRGQPVTYACSVEGPPGTTLHVRTGYPNVRGALTLVRPDGTGPVVLGDGWDAAWSPDGAEIFFRDDDRVWRMPRAGGAPTLVPDTERGRSPAVSPDGSRMTLARRSDAGDWDVWVVALPR